MESRYEQLKQLIDMLNLHVKGKKERALESLKGIVTEENPVKLTLREISLILVGYEGKKGILQAIGGLNHLRKSLKKSAYIAIELAVLLFDRSFQKADYLQVLEGVDRSVLLQMHLDKHFKSNKSRELALSLSRSIQVRLPAVSLDYYLKERKHQEELLKWVEQHRDISPIEPSRWSQVVEAQANIEGNSIRDPLSLKSRIDEDVLKNLVSKQGSAQLKDVLDIKSPQFKANVFLNNVHGSTPTPDLQRGLRNLQQLIQQRQAEFQGVFMTNAPLFSKCTNFFNEVAENLSQDMKTGSSFQVKARFEAIITAETQLLEPLLNRRHEIEKMSKSISMTHRYSTLFKLPALMQTYKSQQDYDLVTELYVKHIGILRKFKSVPFLGKLLAQIEEIAAQVKNEILLHINQAKILDFEFISKSIRQLRSIDPAFDATEFCLTNLHGRVVSQIGTICRESKNTTQKWLQVSSKDTPEDDSEALQALEQIVEKCEAELKLLRDVAEFYLEEENSKERSVRAQKFVKSAAKVFIKEFLAKAKEDSKYKGMSDSIAVHLQTLAPLLQCKIYVKFIQTYMTNFVLWKLSLLEQRIADLWEKESWSKDTMNPHGTSLPRNFVMLLVSTLEDIKKHVGGVSVFGTVLECLLSAVDKFLLALSSTLKKANCAFVDVTKADMILLTLSNAEFVRKTVVPEMLRRVVVMFASEEETLLTQHAEERAGMMVESYVENFAEKYADNQTDHLGEDVLRLCYLEPNEFDLRYADYMEALGKPFVAVSPGALSLINSLVKIDTNLSQKSKSLKSKVMGLVVGKLAKLLTTAIQNLPQHVDPCLYSHILIDLEFISEVLKAHSRDKMSQAYSQLSKLIEQKAVKFSAAELEHKQRILSSAIHRTRLAYESLSPSEPQIDDRGLN